MEIIIRRAQEQDFSEIIVLIKEFALFQQTPERVTITLDQMLKEQAFFQCFVAEIDHKIVAFASFFFTYYSWTGKALYLDDLYVKEAFRKLGIGKKLLYAIIDLAKVQQCKKVRWQVSSWNTNAMDFYKKIGAVIDTTEVNCDLLIK